MDMVNKQAEGVPPEQKKAKQLEAYTENPKGARMTTNMGVGVSNTDDSLKAGLRGPTLIEDFHFREKITHFDHERIPERVVHARGFGAHGFFQLYESMEQYTMAKFLQDTSVKTPVFVRFSTVAGSRGSADTVRDVRGFATKFYTEDGNYDLVGNNIPVFFIQDAIKFPDIIHAVKPEPNNEIPQATTAHDTFWDFVTSAPETAHMVMWTMSDRAIPRSFRMMEGFGVNTFRFVNAQGVSHFVKFHWKPLLGVHSLLRDEAQKLSGKDPDFHRRDLWNAIEQGQYPEYEFGVQLIAEEDEFKFDFDILDPTKLWPEELVPVKIIGQMTLNRNVDNFFSETEQVAFCPANVVPGIDFSDDPLLQGRLFSYQDTQLTRLGGPNFHEIPINKPIVPIHNDQRDGMHRMTINPGPVSYFPNALQQDCPKPVSDSEGGFVHHAERLDGQVLRGRSESFKDFFSQATMFFNSLSLPEKEHLFDGFHFEVGGCKDAKIKQRVVDMFNNVSFELATKIAESVGATPPPAAAASYSTASSPALSQENKVKTPATLKIAILIANGFCFSGVTAVMEALKSAGASAEIVSTHMGKILGQDGAVLEAAKDFTNADSTFYDAVYIAGGQDSVSSLQKLPDALCFINEAFRHLKTIGASGAGVDLLTTSSAAKLDLAPVGSYTPVVESSGVVTTRASDMAAFSAEFVRLLGMHRHWDRQSVIYPAS
jgi:catalase